MNHSKSALSKKGGLYYIHNHYIGIGREMWGLKDKTYVLSRFIVIAIVISITAILHAVSADISAIAS